MGTHSGVPVGSNFAVSAALNGIQVIKLDEPDLNLDEIVNGNDIDLLVAEIASGTHNVVYDVTVDGQVNSQDLNQ